MPSRNHSQIRLGCLRAPMVGNAGFCGLVLQCGLVNIQAAPYAALSWGEACDGRQVVSRFDCLIRTSRLVRVNVMCLRTCRGPEAWSSLAARHRR